MRILHTSDWHIGRRIENIPLAQEFDLFVQWLTQVIEERQIDAMIVAGDIFDTGMPSIAAQRQYYTTIAKLANTRLQKIIIINGNHDSANFLLAPSIILSGLKTHLSAGLPRNLEDLIITLPKDDPQVVIAAVPYLRDIDIINFFQDRAESLDTEKNIAALYHLVAKLVKDYKKQGLPVIVTGHLFVSDSAHDEQEHSDYTLGGLIDVRSSQLPDIFDYYALGHVHRPWKQNNRNVYYCGNPFFMGLNDIKTGIEKGVNIIDTQNITNITRLNTPLWRQMVQFQGDFDHICEQIKNFENTGILSPAYGFVKITDYPGNKPIDQLYEYLVSINPDNIQIIKAIFPPKQMAGKTNNQDLSTLKEYSPREILQFHLDRNGFDKKTTEQLMQTFDQLLTIYRQNQG